MFSTLQPIAETGVCRRGFYGATLWQKRELLRENEGTGYGDGLSVCDTNPAGRTFWRSVWEVATSLTNPCWWARSGTDRRSGIIQAVVFTAFDSFHLA